MADWSFITGLASNAALLSVGAAIVLLVRNTYASIRGEVFLGLLFGALCILVVYTPITLSLGATFDTRAGPALLAGFIGGPISAAITAAMGGAARLAVGGPMAVGGALSLVIYAIVGYGLRRLLGPAEPKLTTITLSLVAGVGTLCTLPAFFVDEGIAFGLSILEIAWFMLVLGNFTGVLVLGLLIRLFQRLYERNRKARREAIIMKLAMRAGQAGVWEYDQAKSLARFDGFTAAMYGLENAARSLTLSEWQSLLVEEDREKLHSTLKKACCSTATFSVDVSLKRGDGETAWICIQGSGTAEGDPSESTLTGIQQDVSQSRRLEDHLRQERQQAEILANELEATLGSMKHGLAVIDKDGNLIIWNDQAREIFNLPEDTVVAGMPYSNILDWHQKRGTFHIPAEKAVKTIRDRLASGKILRSRMPLLDGRTVAITIGPMPDGGWVETHEDITDQVRASEQIEIAATTDALTGLKNRSVFEKVLAQKIDSEATLEPPNALLLVDVDRFKMINDTFGHTVGDEVLRTLGRTLKQCARDGEIALRLGGDEFALLINAADQDELKRRASEVAFAFSTPCKVGDLFLDISISIGAAVFPNEFSTTAEAIFPADGALYAAKGLPGSSFRVFDEEIEQSFARRKRIENKLLRADLNTSFELYYQPIVLLDTQETKAYEALIRWRCPNGTYVSPAEFIPIAEDLGLIGDIGEWVLMTAVREAQSWTDGARIAVNLSPRQIGTGHFAKCVQKALETYGFAPDRLELEFTESVFMQPDTACIGELEALRELGVRLALDDFGTGFSSLSYLHKFKFDKLKLDRSFVADVTTDPDCASIVSSVVDLARKLDLELVAEGIETQVDHNFLMAIGVPLGQGYHFAKPMPRAELPYHCAPLKHAATA
ncbi:diguanylate cyclase (GGDEF)-like protein [Roseibium hamelinense]|uniref:Diguanylate cyclase (GGDEF)-like protein n=1 Tax=Roseibium hamelinense TaxID=150831 RepID=A0A562TGW8_9HYPH|nr:EAL domain-containing protein [Roseibium hamelinense]TWI92879.1 diguanylate cyclase (GGDEF)-like protein [Roseibium hamelinense]